MVNGTLIDTEEEISKRPIAIRSGFFSAFASATIFRREVVLCGPLLARDAGNSRDKKDVFGVCVIGVGVEVGVGVALVV